MTSKFQLNVKGLIIASLCSAGLALSSGSALAERPDGVGGGNPGTGGGGKPDNPGGGGGKPDQPGRGKGGLYADLVVLWRDAYGAPKLTEMPVVGEGGGTVDCLQPITPVDVPVDGNNLPKVLNPADGSMVSLIPLGGSGAEGEECDVDPAYAGYVQEVLFGRLNMGRAPEKVLAQQYRDITGSLASSTKPVDIDEAGRLVYYLGDAAFEVDSPGHNLAIHQELMEDGTLENQSQVSIVLPGAGNPDASDRMDHAAAALGAAAGKGDLINLDLIAYNNRILGIPNDTDLTTVTVNGEKYVDYDANSFRYTRSKVFPGCVRGQLVNFPGIGESRYFSGPIFHCVFGTITDNGVDAVATCSAGEDFTGATGIHRFAQRADDARAVIAFVHDNVVNDSTAILPLAVAGVDQAGETDLADSNGDVCPPPLNAPVAPAASSAEALQSSGKGKR